MYESLRSWCNQPITVQHVGKRLPSGEAAPGVKEKILGYVVDDTKTITDKSGNLYQCQSYFYVDLMSEEPVLIDDTVFLPDNPNGYEVRKLGAYYDGNTGCASVQVVYL